VNNSLILSELTMPSHTHIQKTLASKTLSLAKSTGVMNNEARELQFFFYADSFDQANPLRQYLIKELQYQVDKLYKLDEKWSIHGTLDKEVVLTEEYFEEWIEEMNILAERFEVEFDGWEFPLEEQ
jgi:hypothetical protein